MTALHSLPYKRGTALTLEGVGKRFGERDVLQGIDLTIPSGQFVVVVGRSGCGKSTLLRLVAGLDKPTGGQLLTGKEPLARHQDATRLMFQDARLLPWKRIIDNVGLGLKGHWQQKALEALDAVGLAERAHEWPAALSGGQKQRVALARPGGLEDQVLQQRFDAGAGVGHGIEPDGLRLHEQRREQVAFVAVRREQHVLVDGQHIAVGLLRKVEAVRQRRVDGQRHRPVAFPQVAVDVRADLSAQ